jgi:pyruvate/2-oxoglutarate dehydrogenase complex dihydrolipoamide acyltransferase (E2) component
MQQSRASRFHCSERPTKLNQQLLRPFNHRTLQQSHRKHSTMEGDYALPNMAEQHMRSQSFDAPQVTMETDGHFGDDGPGGMMQHEDSLFADASMADVGDMYGLGDTLSQAPYYGIPQVDPDLSQLFDDDMADVDLQADSNDVSPTQASLTPANRPKRSLSKRNKKGKQKQVAVIEDPDSQVPSEDEDEDEDDIEQPEDESDEFTPEPAAAKKRTPSKRTPKRAARKSAGSSRRKSAAKPQDDIPFNRLRRAPKNGIVEARPIARCYEECDEADKALLDLRERELKTWKEIRVVWEEMTGHKTGNSTLPNRYE